MNPESKDRSFRDRDAAPSPSPSAAPAGATDPANEPAPAGAEAQPYTGPERRAQGILVAEIIADGEPEHRAAEGAPR